MENNIIMNETDLQSELRSSRFLVKHHFML